MFNLRIACLLLISSLFSACVSKSEHTALEAQFNQLRSENAQLKSKLDELEHGEPRLVAQIEQAYSSAEYGTAKKLIADFRTWHPESPMNAKYVELSAKIDQAMRDQKAKEEAEEEARQAKIEAEQKERERIANLQNTGIWTVKHYVDNFGEPTNDTYITNKEPIKGAFSNSATQDSPLIVHFLLEGPQEMAFQLYEYAGNNPVKDSGYDNEYYIYLKDGEGKRYELEGKNYGDRISLKGIGARKLHEALMKGGALQFHVVKARMPTTQYDFPILNADYYDHAVALRQEKSPS